MSKLLLYSCISCFLLVSCGDQPSESRTEWLPDQDPFEFRIDTMTFLDSVRSRKIPVALYHESNGIPSYMNRVIIFSHGYNFNAPNSYRAYSYLTDTLAKLGYLVASVQHELPGDDTIAFEGDIQTLRLPFWESGAANIRHVYSELQRKGRISQDAKVTLIGHSNGGDISTYLAGKDSILVDELITLDHLRVRTPVRNSLRVLSIRATDKNPDPGVLPMEPYPNNFRVVKLKQTNHSDMSDGNTAEQQKEILDPLIDFLKSRK